MTIYGFVWLDHLSGEFHLTDFGWVTLVLLFLFFCQVV